MRRWTRVVGDGIAFSGGCLLHILIFEAGDSERYVEIYDGRDSGSGKLLSRHKMNFEATHCDSFPGGIPMDRGIYINAESSEEKTTVIFEPLPE